MANGFNTTNNGKSKSTRSQGTINQGKCSTINGRRSPGSGGKSPGKSVAPFGLRPPEGNPGFGKSVVPFCPPKA